MDCQTVFQYIFNKCLTWTVDISVDPALSTLGSGLSSPPFSGSIWQKTRIRDLKKHYLHFTSIQHLHSLQALSLPSWQRRNEGGPLLSLAWPKVNIVRLVGLEVSLLPCLPLGLATLPSSGPPLLSHIILSSFLSPFAISILTSEWDILVWKLYKHKTLLKFTCLADIIWAEIFLVLCWCMIYDGVWLILHCMYETLVLWPGPD